MAACRMTNNFDIHQSVLLDEVIEQLAIKPDGIYIDATFGRGGHAEAILKQLGPKGQLIAFDKDPDAVLFARTYFQKDSRFSIFHASYAALKSYLLSMDLVSKVDGILLDLGVSSPQLDNPDRGFSFMRNGKLDMRMDTSQGESAAEWLANVDEKELADILWTFGEERFSRRIARFIVEARQEAPIVTTHQLADLIAKAVPFRERNKHPATRSFQAIRMVINHELDELQLGLTQAFEILKIGGRMLVISFHSLEDRLVKRFFQEKEKGVTIPLRLPLKHQDIPCPLKRLGRFKATEVEMTRNPRARSAVLRIAEKLL